MASTPILLDEEKIEELLSSKESFMFDCDGVLWKQGDAYPGVPELIKHLRNLGKKVFFITNNNTKSRRQYLEKFSRIGIDVNESEIYSSAYAAAYYIKHVAKIRGKVYVLGMAGLIEELDNQEIPHTGSGPDEVEFSDWDKDCGFTIDPEVTCVLHSFDRYYNYTKLRKAVNYIAKPSVQFLATNKDMRIVAGNGVISPGTGSLVMATEAAAGKKATVIGKPESVMMDCIAQQHNIDPKKACMFGDNIYTDIEFGNRSNASTVLVLSGVSTLADVESERKLSGAERNVKIPEFYISSMSEFYKLMINKK